MPDMQDPLTSIPFSCYVAGVPHRKPSTLPQVGDVVQLEPEPTNIYDPFAIKVMFKSVHLGYIPKTETQRVRDQQLNRLFCIKTQQVKWKEVKLSNILEAQPIETTALSNEAGPASQL